MPEEKDKQIAHVIRLYETIVSDYEKRDYELYNGEFQFIRNVIERIAFLERQL